jgi:hypothetical protein
MVDNVHAQGQGYFGQIKQLTVPVALKTVVLNVPLAVALELLPQRNQILQQLVVDSKRRQEIRGVGL